MQSRSCVAALFLVLLVPAFNASAEEKSLVFFPLANLGVSSPNGFEATAGVLFGTITDDVIKGPTASIRFNRATDYGFSIGPGYVEELTLGGFGANLWLSSNFSSVGFSGFSVSAEGYLRLLIFEVRAGLLGGHDEGTRGEFVLLPVIGINLGI